MRIIVDAGIARMLTRSNKTGFDAITSRTRSATPTAPIERKERAEEGGGYACTCCKYRSDRLFNVVRHERRIHAPRPYARVCCGELFYTKGEYYLHVEKIHPQKRLSAITSRTKYKILRSMSRISTIDDRTSGRVRRSGSSSTYAWVERTTRTTRRTQRRASARLREKCREREESSKIVVRLVEKSRRRLDEDLQDVPLINFLKDRRLRAYMRRRIGDYVRRARTVVDEDDDDEVAYSRATIVRETLKEETFVAKSEVNNNDVLVASGVDGFREFAACAEECQRVVRDETQILRIVRSQENLRFDENREFALDCCAESRNDEDRLDDDYCDDVARFATFDESDGVDEKEGIGGISGSDLLSESRTSSLTESLTESLTDLSLTGSSLTGSLTISQTISQTITTTCSMPLKMRMLKESLPLKKRALTEPTCVGPLQEITAANCRQSRRRDVAKRKKDSRSNHNAQKRFNENKENEYPFAVSLKKFVNNSNRRICGVANEQQREIRARSPVNITFENIVNHPVVTQYHRDFLEYIDFDKFKTF